MLTYSAIIYHSLIEELVTPTCYTPRLVAATYELLPAALDQSLITELPVVVRTYP